MQYVKRRGTKKNAKHITRSQRMRVSSIETEQARIFANVPSHKRKKISLKRPWDKRRSSKRLKVLLNVSAAMIAAGFEPLD